MQCLLITLFPTRERNVLLLLNSCIEADCVRAARSLFQLYRAGFTLEEVLDAFDGPLETDHL